MMTIEFHHNSPANFNSKDRVLAKACRYYADPPEKNWYYRHEFFKDRAKKTRHGYLIRGEEKVELKVTDDNRLYYYIEARDYSPQNKVTVNRYVQPIFYLDKILEDLRRWGCGFDNTGSILKDKKFIPLEELDDEGLQAIIDAWGKEGLKTFNPSWKYCSWEWVAKAEGHPIDLDCYKNKHDWSVKG